jgi:hypothetical protein
VVGRKSLPDSPAYSKNHSHQYLNANELSEAGELDAFETACSWLQENLKQQGYQVQVT